jgi:hypothetical protein
MPTQFLVFHGLRFWSAHDLDTRGVMIGLCGSRKSDRPAGVIVDAQESYHREPRNLALLGV